jgi:hypothetical protein
LGGDRGGLAFTGDTIANVGTVMLGTFNQHRARTVASGAGARIREMAGQL